MERQVDIGAAAEGAQAQSDGGGAQGDAKTAKQLASIQRAVDSEVARIAEARKAAVGGTSIARIAKLSGLSRQTFYNKPILKEYALRAIDEAGLGEGCDGVLGLGKERSEIARLKKELAEKDEIIARLVARDGELVEAKMQLRDAMQEIAGLKASQAESRGTIAGLRRMLDEATREGKPTRIVKMG